MTIHWDTPTVHVRMEFPERPYWVDPDGSACTLHEGMVWRINCFIETDSDFNFINWIRLGASGVWHSFHERIPTTITRKRLSGNPAS